MAQARNGNDASALGDPRLERITQQFEDQWKQAVRGRLLPSVDIHLERVDAESRPILRDILAAVELRYRKRLAESPVEYLHDSAILQSKAVGLDETAEHVAKAAGATTDRGTSQERRCPACNAALPRESAEKLCPKCLLGEGMREATCDEVPPDIVQPPLSQQDTGVYAFNSQSTDQERQAPADAGLPADALRPTEEIVVGETPRDSASPSRTPRPALPGYEILDELGRGGMGVVYRARQLGLNRLVALKMILPGGDHADQAQRARFQSEAEAVAQLQHSNIVQIYDVGEYNSLPYFSLELVDGQSLVEEMEGNPVAPDHAVEVVEAVAHAMQAAHEHGIVHRDLKPANILVTRNGVPKVTDFGLVKRVEGDSGQTRTGAIVGTPSFMSPEQARGDKQVEPAMDIYALGALLYCLLTGRAPFLGATIVETVMQVIHREPLPPSRLQPQTPKDLETICLKCLEKDASKRYASANELAEDLRRFRQGIPTTARPVSRAERAWRWCRRNPWITVPTAAAALLALILMIGGPLTAAVVYQQKQRADANAQAATKADEISLETIRSLIYAAQEELRLQGMIQLRQKLLAIALNGINKTMANNQDYRGANMAIASAIRRQGDILLEIGESEKALELYNHSLKMLRTLEAEKELTRPHLNYAVLYDHFGQALRRSGKPVEAKHYFLKALRHYEVWLAEEPENFGILQELAGTYGRLGNVAKTLGNPAETRDYFTKSMEIRKQWIAAEPHNLDAQREMAGAMSDFSKACFMFGDLKEATRFARESVDILDKLFQANPNDLIIRWNLALKYRSLGDVVLLAGQPSAAKDYYQKSVTRLQELSEENPRNALMKQHLGRALYGLATACKALDEPAAKEHYRESMELREKLAKDDPKNTGKQLDYVLTLPRCGEHELAANMADELRKSSTNSSALYTLAGAYALCSTAASNEDQQQTYRQQALAALRDAVAAGFADVVLLPRDPDLESLRNYEEFERLVKQLQNRQDERQDDDDKPG